MPKPCRIFSRRLYLEVSFDHLHFHSLEFVLYCTLSRRKFLASLPQTKVPSMISVPFEFELDNLSFYSRFDVGCFLYVTGWYRFIIVLVMDKGS